MNLHQLSVFRSVVETGSFSKAALQLRLAQSAVSYHVKALEQEIGTPLFARLKTRVELTGKGERLSWHMRRIFDAVADAEQDLRSGAPAPAELRFALGVSSLSGQLPAYVRRLRKSWPGTRFRLTAGSTPKMIELLRQGDADLAVVSLPIQDRDIWTSAMFYEEEEMMVVVNRKGAFARRPVISPGELAKIPLILYNRTTATRASLDEFFRQSGVAPTVIMEADREENILALVRSGLGATILPRCFLTARHKERWLRVACLRNAYLRRQVGVALPGTASRTPLVNAAVRLCHEHFHGRRADAG